MPPTADRPTVAPDRVLTHPLDRLKGIIRRFVAYDVLLFAGLFLSLWFWIGVGVDFGLFSAFGLDVAQQLTPALRIGVTAALALTLVGLVAWRVSVLVNKDLSLTSLALVLEKRHPKLLGDRLITAIEMADVEKAREAGYSADMVRHTIDEARERMEQVNVRAVFAWGRLWLKGGLIAGVWVVGVVAALAIHAAATRTADLPRGGKAMADVCGIFTERNALFRPTPWLRRAHIEVVEFDDEGHPNELRVGKGAAVPPKITARAVKWVRDDDPWANPDGWRALTVADLPVFGAAAEAPAEVVLDPAAIWTQTAADAPQPLGERILAKKLDLPAAARKLAEGWQAARAKVLKAGDEANLTPADRDALRKRLEAIDADLDALKTVRLDLSPARRIDDVEREWLDRRGEVTERLNKLRASVEELKKKGAGEEARAAEFQANYLAEAGAYLDTAFTRLDERAAALENTRKLRKLAVPEKLRLRYDGLQTRSRNFAELVPDATGKYATDVTNLAESVRFTVSAEDFVTARRQITLVPPPTFVDLFRDEYQPAYLHFSGPIVDDQQRQQIGLGTADPLFALRGRMQKLAGKKVSITSDKSTFSAPVGSELHITAEADKDLKAVEVRAVGNNPLTAPDFLRAETRRDGTDPATGNPRAEYPPLAITRPEKAVETRLEVDRPDATGLRVSAPLRRFTLAFEGKRAIRQLDKPTEFQIVMTDTDNVVSVRTIAVTATDDAPPQVDVLVDPVIRRMGGAYMVTPIARVPFLPDSKVSDAEGLSSVRFEFEKQEEEAKSLKELRAMAAVAVAANALAPSPSWAMPATVLHAQTQFDLVYGSTIPQTDSTGTARLPGVDVPRFENELKNLVRPTLVGLDTATAPRPEAMTAERLLPQELVARKIDLTKMKPEEAAAAVNAVRADLRAQLADPVKRAKRADAERAAAPGSPGDRGPQAVKSIKLSDPRTDAFDLQAYMPELLERQTATGAVQKQYNIKLFVVAKDTNVELTGKDGKPAEPRTTRNLDPIRLMVVSEQDLLVEIGKDEEMQVTRMEDTAKKAGDGKGKLDREFSLIRTLPAKTGKERTDQLLSSQVRLTDITQDLAKVREILSAMRTEYEKLYREMEVNRFAAPNMRKYRNEAGTAEEAQTGYLDLLAQVLDENRALAKAEKSVEAVRSALAAAQTPTDAALTAANFDYVALLQLLARLENQITVGNSYQKALRDLQGIIKAQLEQGQAIALVREDLEKEVKRPTIVLPKQVTTVAAGKSVKVKLGVRWKLYPESSLFVGVEVPKETGLTLPKELIVKAKDDEDVTEVEVQVTAGAKTGVHTVTLRPGNFRPVELQIEVTK